MLFLRFFLFVLSSVFVVAAVLLVAYDIFLIFQVGRWLKPKETPDNAGREAGGDTSASPTSTTSTTTGRLRRVSFQHNCELNGQGARFGGLPWPSLS